MRPVRAKGSFSSNTFTPVSSVPITFDSNRTSLALPYSGFSKPAHCASQPHMVWREMSAPCRSKIFSCLFRGRWSAVLATITCASRLAPAVLFSIGCGGLVAVFTVQSQAYFLQTSSTTFSCAGMYS
jgi:hypothetical protein